MCVRFELHYVFSRCSLISHHTFFWYTYLLGALAKSLLLSLSSLPFSLFIFVCQSENLRQLCSYRNGNLLKCTQNERVCVCLCEEGIECSEIILYQHWNFNKIVSVYLCVFFLFCHQNQQRQSDHKNESATFTAMMQIPNEKFYGKNTFKSTLMMNRFKILIKTQANKYFE